VDILIPRHLVTEKRKATYKINNGYRRHKYNYSFGQGGRTQGSILVASIKRSEHKKNKIGKALGLPDSSELECITVIRQDFSFQWT
jgi:hypothetical protein